MEDSLCSESTMSFFIQPCDFCNSNVAVLYCKADSAKLCLLCDHQVHCANALSLKHLRSLICDNCGAEPASVHCSKDNLVLCQHCDASSSVSSSLYSRTPIEGFMGCPSAIELASILELDLNPKIFTNSDIGYPLYEQNMVNLHDLVVPSGSFSVFLCTEKCRREMHQQLIELGKRENMRVNGDAEELGPETPPSRCEQLGNSESLEMENVDEEELLNQQMPLTSLLMLPNQEDARESDGVAEGDLLWDCSPTYQAAQIWDFQLGTTRDGAEPGPEEAGYDAKDPGFRIKNYRNLTKEAAFFNARKLLEDTNELSCSAPCEDILSRDSCSNKQLSRHTARTGETESTSLIESSSESILEEAKTCYSPRHAKVVERPRLGWFGTADRVRPKVDTELLAQNRCIAILRYKEKKKTRRFDNRVRYESRKAMADSRKRVKGRFVKASENC
ncbi:hypothetical protein P3X46_033694 [Hevea brasiliensis]|uniref:Zinc finger protein CONSTANS-LIKE 13-like n=2 Tax=Hevea brasiliensis TaxID=3981 RepID=A0ABQ9KC30_HEVBR|nr:hypothetical protein P3X46_033694 [Hevea brasiliensis]